MYEIHGHFITGDPYMAIAESEKELHSILEEIETNVTARIPEKIYNSERENIVSKYYDII